MIARVWPARSEDSGRGVVRTDGHLRKATGVRVDDPVEVEPADVARRLSRSIPARPRRS